jgi:hypothetical protein
MHGIHVALGTEDSKVFHSAGSPLLKARLVKHVTDGIGAAQTHKSFLIPQPGPHKKVITDATEIIGLEYNLTGYQRRRWCRDNGRGQSRKC